MEEVKIVTKLKNKGCIELKMKPRKEKKKNNVAKYHLLTNEFICSNGTVVGPTGPLFCIIKDIVELKCLI